MCLWGFSMGLWVCPSGSLGVSGGVSRGTSGCVFGGVSGVSLSVSLEALSGCVSTGL